MEINKIYLADCISFMSAMENKSVDMTLTDIPYSECNKESAGLREIDKGSANTLSFDLDKFLGEVVRLTKGSIYIFCGIEQVSPIYKKLGDYGLITRHCIWEKKNPSPMNGQSTWLSATENCVFAKFSGATFNEFCQPNVWREKSHNTLGRTAIHPTEKPVLLFKKLIEASSNPGDLIFDPCIGSGTTAVAALSLSRSFIGVEINEEYYKEAIKRVAREQSLYK